MLVFWVNVRSDHKDASSQRVQDSYTTVLPASHSTVLSCDLVEQSWETKNDAEQKLCKNVTDSKYVND